MPPAAMREVQVVIAKHGGLGNLIVLGNTINKGNDAASAINAVNSYVTR